MTDASPPDPGAALAEYALAELERAIAHLAWRGTRRHEGVHQARKSMRRVRATVRLGRDVFGERGDAISARLREAIKLLSELRDAQALVEALDRVAPAFPDAADQQCLRRARARAARRRAAIGKRMNAPPTPAQQAAAIVFGISAGVRRLPWTALTPEHVGSAAIHSLHRAAKAGNRARTSGKSADWHRWRRQLRRLLQQQRALLTVSLEPLDEQLPAKAVAVALGEAQDCALVLEHCRDKSLFGEDRSRLRELVRREQDRLRQKVTRLADEGSEF